MQDEKTRNQVDLDGSLYPKKKQRYRLGRLSNLSGSDHPCNVPLISETLPGHYRVQKASWYIERNQLLELGTLFSPYHRLPIQFANIQILNQSLKNISSQQACVEYPQLLE